MLIRLLRIYLQRYKRELVFVLILQTAQTFAALYLPSLNADIIDNGIARGDTAYIMSTGGWMLAVTLLQVACSVAAVYFGARTGMGFGRDVRSALFHRVGEFSAHELGRFGAPSRLLANVNTPDEYERACARATMA